MSAYTKENRAMWGPDREDLIVRTGVTGDNRLLSDLDQIHCVPGGVSGTNCAFSSTVSSHCQWGLPLLIHPTVIHCIKFKEAITCAPPYRWAPTLPSLNLLIRHQVLYSHPRGYCSQESVHPPTLKGVCALRGTFLNSHRQKLQ